MKWKSKTGTLYSGHASHEGKGRTFQQLLFSDFGENMNQICSLRNLDRTAPDYEQTKRSIKNRMPCFALNELADDRKTVISYSGLMQIDFDKKDCEGYDIAELKQAVFSLPFIAFVSLSCSGDGFYAIAAIAEPEKQKEYAEHIFKVLDQYGITCDRSKGRNYNDLRYLSYDANMLDREDVEPLRITHFKAETTAAIRKVTQYTSKPLDGSNEAEKALKKILQIEAKGIDIAPNYDEYLSLAFAFANEFGEGGRDYFHRVCALSPKYNYRDADIKYSNAIKTNTGAVKMGKFYYLCGLSGI